MKSTTRMIAAVAVSSFAAVAFAAMPASAMPTVKQGVTLESPLVQQVAWWNKKRCKYVKKVRWHHGHKVVKYVKVCR